jgi:hypothetical protein
VRFASVQTVEKIPNGAARNRKRTQRVRYTSASGVSQKPK